MIKKQRKIIKEMKCLVKSLQRTLDSNVSKYFVFS